MCRALFALVCAATLLVASDCQQQASDNAAVPIQELPSFSTVQACVPFNILIEPSGTSGGVAYGLQVEAEPQVASAIKATVGGDTLRLETGSFITRQPIKAVVYLPADRLLALDMLGFGANAYIAEGFRPSNFSLRLSSGTGGAFVFNMTTDSASVQTQSTGDVVLTGSYRTVTVSSSGISSLYVGGVTESADLQLSGISNVYVQPASDSVTIGGTASGISTVQYSQGQCAVQSAFLFTSPCEQTSSISLQIPVPSWTQGLTAVGSFSCGVAEGFLAPPQLLPSLQQPAFQFPTFQLAPIAPIQLAPIQAATMPATGSAPSSGQASVSASGQGLSMGSPAPSGGTTSGGTSAMPLPSIVEVAPPPTAETLQGQNPYAIGVQTPAGSQFQAGSVTPGGSNAQSAATGQRFASASSVAGPGLASTQTSNDNGGFATRTGG